MGATHLRSSENSKLKGIVQEANGLKRVLWTEARRKIIDSEITEYEFYAHLVKQGILTENPVRDNILVLDEGFESVLPRGYFFTNEFYANQYSNERLRNSSTHKLKYIPKYKTV